MSKNPFRIPSKDTKQIRIHKDLYYVILKEAKKQQRVSDMKFGKNKYKVKNTFASKILGGILK